MTKPGWTTCARCGQDIVNSHNGHKSHDEFCPVLVPPWQVALAHAWHSRFGAVKCWMTRCPICRDSHWPVATWVSRRQHG